MKIKIPTAADLMLQISATCRPGRSFISILELSVSTIDYFRKIEILYQFCPQSERVKEDTEFIILKMEDEEKLKSFTFRSNRADLKTLVHAGQTFLDTGMIISLKPAI